MAQLEFTTTATAAVCVICGCWAGVVLERTVAQDATDQNNRAVCFVVSATQYLDFEYRTCD